MTWEELAVSPLVQTAASEGQAQRPLAEETRARAHSCTGLLKQIRDGAGVSNESGSECVVGAGRRRVAFFFIFFFIVVIVDRRRA